MAAASLVSLEIVLCIVFGGFMLVLMVEVYYIFHSRHNREAEQSNLSTRERGFTLNRGSNSFLGIRYFGRRLKHGIRYLIYGVNHQENSFRRNSLLFNANNHHHQERTAIVMEDEGQASTSTSTISFPSASSPPTGHCEFVAKLFPLQGDFSGDVDILHLQALLGPPRLLFTIKEETKEDLESEDAKSRAGRSRGASRASSEFIPLPDSGTATPLETPFVTPPSSPLLTSPSTSPPLPPLPNHAKHDREEDVDDASSPHLLKPLNIFVDESSSLSSSSSENFTPPIPSSPPKLLSTEETSSSSSSSTATPFIMSPQLLVHSQKHSRSSLGAFLDVPSQNRIYPIETPSFKNSDFVLMSNVEEVPLNVSPFKRIKESETVQLIRQFQQSGELSSTPSPSWPPSPPTLPASPLTPPLCSAHSSPLFTSPILGSVNGD